MRFATAMLIASLMQCVTAHHTLWNNMRAYRPARHIIQHFIHSGTLLSYNYVSTHKLLCCTLYNYEHFYTQKLQPSLIPSVLPVFYVHM